MTALFGWNLLGNPIRRAFALAILVPLLGLLATEARAAPTVLTTSDGVIRNNLCVGANCIDSPSFGFNTEMLRSDNLRLLFDDSSTVGGNPANDWRLLANEQGIGNRNLFAIEDCGIDLCASSSGTGGVFPFAVEAGAADKSVYVKSNSDVGLGTKDPVLDLQITSGDGPGIRLEQNTSQSFPAENWDIEGNETNFFVRNRGLLPFRIRPGAPQSSIDIAANGNVGFGDSTPDFPLDLERSNGSAAIAVTEMGGAGDQKLLNLTGKTSALARYANSDASREWLAGIAQNGDFSFANSAIGDPAVSRLTIGAGGELWAKGAISQGAAAGSQIEVTPANPAAIMASLRPLAISRYKNAADPGGRVHLGPAGLDFSSAFGLGESQSLAPADLAGVALVALQNLDTRVTALDNGNDLQAQIDALKSTTLGDVNDLQVQIDTLDTRVTALDNGSNLQAQINSLKTRVTKVGKTANKANKTANRANKTARKALKLAKRR